MSGAVEFNYESIDLPYNNNMQRGGNSNSVEITPSTGFGVAEGSGSSDSGGGSSGEGVVLRAGQELTDVWVATWLKSRNFQPKTQGFMIDGKTGYIECMRIFVG